MMRTRRQERGAALLIAIGATTTLLAILVAAAATQRVVIQQARQRVERIRAREVAMAGVQRAITDIATQYASSATTTTTTSGSSSNSPSLTTLQDDWARLGDTGNIKFTVGEESFRVQVIDSSALIDINTATQAQLERLPLTAEQIDSILDFRETSRTPRSLGGKDEYYNNLSEPYNAKLGRFSTVDQLLQVKGFTGKTLFEANNNFSSTGGQVLGADGQPPVLIDVLTAYSYSPQLNSQGQAKVNVNAPGTNVQTLLRAPVSLPPPLAQQIAARKTWTGLGQILALNGAASNTVQKSILNNLQVGGAPRSAGKINLNTASQSTLQSISQLTPDLVQAIISRQSQIYTTLGDLVDVPGISSTILRDVADALEVMIDVQNNKPKIVAVSEPPLDDMTVRWGWAADPTSETELVVAQ